MVVKVKNSLELKKALENREQFEFDTSVVFDKDNAVYKTVLDVEDIIRNAPRTDRVLDNLYEAISKLKKTKEGTLFFNAVARKLGEDMDAIVTSDGYIKTVLYGKKYDDFGVLVNFLFPSYGVKFEPETDMVRMIVNSDWDSMQRWKPGKIRFDASNRVHNNLARIINQLPENSKYFRGFKDAWIKDTRPSEHIKKIKEKFDKQDAEKGIERIENAVWPNASYGNNLEALVKKYYKTYGDSTRAIVIKWAIKNAPVNITVAMDIAEFLKYTAPTKAFGIKEISDLTDAFYKRYGDVIKELKQEGKDLLPQLETAKEAQKNLKTVLADENNLRRKGRAWDDFRDHLGTLRNDFFYILRKEPLTKKETTFYTALYNKLNEQVETFLKTKDSSVLKNIQIEGHPWVLWGSKQEEGHLGMFNAVLSKYNDYIVKIPEEYTEEDRAKFEELNKRSSASRLYGNEYREDEDVKRLQGRLDIVDSQIAKIGKAEGPKQRYAEIYSEAKKKLEAKRKETPVVESGYMKWRKDVESAEEKKQLDRLMKKIKPANPELTEEQLMALAIRIMQEKTKR